MRLAAVALLVFAALVTRSLPAKAEEPVDPQEGANPGPSPLLVMVTGDLKYGFAREQGVVREDMYFGDEWETSELGRVGVGAFLGGMPSPPSNFTFGARLGVESLIVKRMTIPLLSGIVSAGVTLGEPREREFGFFLAGVGAEGIPGLTPAVLAVHLLGGTTVDGAVLAAGVDVGLTREFSYFLFGIELGWGRFIKHGAKGGQQQRGWMPSPRPCWPPAAARSDPSPI